MIRNPKRRILDGSAKRRRQPRNESIPLIQKQDLSEEAIKKLTGKKTISSARG